MPARGLGAPLSAYETYGLCAVLCNPWHSGLSLVGPRIQRHTCKSQALEPAPALTSTVNGSRLLHFSHHSRLPGSGPQHMGPIPGSPAGASSLQATGRWPSWAQPSSGGQGAEIQLL